MLKSNKNIHSNREKLKMAITVKSLQKIVFPTKETLLLPPERDRTRI